MYPDFKELLSIFNAHRVKYLIVGGYAVGFHSQPRATKDLDLLVRPDPPNAQAVYDSLAQFGAPLETVTPEDFLDRRGIFRIGHAPVMIEILTAIDGIEFDDAWERRVQVTIDGGADLYAPMISRDDLIAAKLATARPQDLADVDAIRKAAAAQCPKDEEDLK